MNTKQNKDWAEELVLEIADSIGFECDIALIRAAFEKQTAELRRDMENYKAFFEAERLIGDGLQQRAESAEARVAWLEAAKRGCNKERDSLREQLTQAKKFIGDISKQRPEKPDHWTPCGQCEDNISNAKDIIDAARAKEAT